METAPTTGHTAEATVQAAPAQPIAKATEHDTPLATKQISVVPTQPKTIASRGSTRKALEVGLQYLRTHA